jgi:hypothetical protein
MMKNNFGKKLVNTRAVILYIDYFINTAKVFTRVKEVLRKVMFEEKVFCNGWTRLYFF